MTSNSQGYSRWNRRQILGLGAAGLAVAYSGRQAWAAEPTKTPVQLSWFEAPEYAPLFAAEKMGFDAALGFKQTFMPGGPQINPIQTVAAGTAAIGMVASLRNLIQARANGIPVKAIGALCRQSPIGLMSLADKPIRTPADAVGKKVGLPNGARLVWQLILAANGVSPDKITIIPAGPGSAPLLSGQVDGKWGSAAEEQVALEHQGIKTHMMTGDAVGVPDHFGVMFTTDAVLASNRDLVVNWMKSTIAGIKYVADHTEEMAQYVSDRAPGLKLDPADNLRQLLALKQFQPARGKYLPPGALDTESASTGIEQLAAAVKLPTTPTLDDIYDESIYKQASA